MSHEATWGELLEDAVRSRQLGCFEVEEIAAVAFEDAPPELTERVLEHAEGCRVCATELELARRFEADEAGIGDDAVEEIVAVLSAQGQEAERSAGGRSGHKILALAATVLVASMAGVLLWLQGGERVPVLPDPVSSTVVRGGSVVLLEPSGVLEAAPERWQWRTVAGAERYRFELVRVDGTVVFETEVPAATGERGLVTLTTDLRSVLEPAVRYRWRVLALDGAGEEIARSPDATVRLAPGASERSDR